MARGMYSRNTASRLLRTGMSRGGSLLICCSVCLCLALRQAEAQVHPQLKAQRPSKYACPVTANLSPRQERAGSMLRFIFPEELLTSEKAARRISIALVSSNGKDVEIPFIWTDVGPYYGSFIVRADGSPNCYFLDGYAGLPGNVPCVEFSLDIPPGIEVKEVSFSSLGGEYVSRNCPMPELGKEIMKAYEESRLNPQDATKTARFITLMEKALPEYDCVQKTGWGPVPAWCLIDEDNLDTIVSLIQYLYEKVGEANESALRVFAGMFDHADGVISEMMADQIWEVMHDKPLFILKVWPDIRNYRRNIVLISSGLQDIDDVHNMAEIYREVAKNELKYKSACDEIVGILSKRG
jgi:hypothetical protein